MKKLLLITLICIIASWLFADAPTPRFYTQLITNETTTDGQLPGVINASTATAANYHLTAWVTTRPTEVLSTNAALDTDEADGASAPAIIRIWRFGNGTTVPYVTVAGVALGEFLTPFAIGDIVHLQIDYLGSVVGFDPVTVASWEMTIPTGTAAINWNSVAASLIPIPSVPPYLAPVTDWDITINSTPSAPIYLDGVNTTQVTPWTFTYAAGFTGLFTVVLPNYTWVPADYQVTALGADLTINFAGTLHTPPPAFTYVYPADNAIDQPLALLLDWNAAIEVARNGGKNIQTSRDDAVSYNVWFGPVGGMVQVATGVLVTEYPVSGLLNNTEYEWQIVAVNAYGQTLGPIWSFTTLAAPPITYQATITSTPTQGYDIYDTAGLTGQVTDYTFTWAVGSSHDITLEPVTGFHWVPASITVNAAGTYNFDLVANPVVYYDVYVTSVPTGAAIWINGVNVGTTPGGPYSYPEHSALNVSVVLAHYTFVPQTIADLTANANLNFVGTYVPWIMYDVLITSSPVGQPILFNGGPTGQTTPWTFQLLEGTGGTYSIGNPLFTWAPLSFGVINIQGNLSQNFVGTLIPTTYTVTVFSNPTGALIYVDGVSTGLYTAPGGTIITLLLPGPHVITLGPVVVDNVTYTFPTPIPATTNGQQINFDGTVPVELSSFTATVTSDLFVNLVWVVQSETQVLGYNIYRAGTSDVAASSRVNNQIINANNLSTQQTYSFVDDTEGLAADNTYYYWLENVDMTGYVNLYGPRMVTITGTVTPPLPTSSVLNNAYPNPFRMGGTANIGVKVAEGETGTLTIFNLLGQKIVEKTYGAGEFNFEWNAKGNASGIYFYKLSTPSTNVTKKLVIVN